jgi:hypothetical protein
MAVPVRVGLGSMVGMAGNFGATVSIDVDRGIMIVKISYDSPEIVNNINRLCKVM